MNILVSIRLRESWFSLDDEGIGVLLASDAYTHLLYLEPPSCVLHGDVTLPKERNGLNVR
jgi:hypothetical protein